MTGVRVYVPRQEYRHAVSPTTDPESIRRAYVATYGRPMPDGFLTREPSPAP